MTVVGLCIPLRSIILFAALESLSDCFVKVTKQRTLEGKISFPILWLGSI
jgi:hypothetical protein